MRIGKGFLAVSLLAMIVVAPTAGVGAAGDSDAALACQQGGSQSYVGVSGDLVTHTFVDANDCAMYAAHGGRVFLATPAIMSCANGGYAEYYRTDRTPFANEAQCVSYVGEGGALQRRKAVLSVQSTFVPGGYALIMTGSGLKAGGALTLSATFAGYGRLSLIAGTADGNGDFSRRMTNVSCATFSDFVLSAKAADGDTSSSGAPYTAC